MGCVNITVNQIKAKQESRQGGGGGTASPDRDAEEGDCSPSQPSTQQTRTQTGKKLARTLQSYWRGQGTGMLWGSMLMREDA